MLLLIEYPTIFVVDTSFKKKKNLIFVIWCLRLSLMCDEAGKTCTNENSNLIAGDSIHAATIGLEDIPAEQCILIGCSFDHLFRC